MLFNNMNADQILKNAKSILLVDWPGESVPAALIKAGFTVYSYSPAKYSRAQFNETGALVFLDIDGAPQTVDIVNIFRPEAEHAAIIKEHVLPLKAGVLWLHPPVTSEITAELAHNYGVTFVEGINIADVAAKL